jgi:hypothetical protein
MLRGGGNWLGVDEFVGRGTSHGLACGGRSGGKGPVAESGGLPALPAFCDSFGFSNCLLLARSRRDSPPLSSLLVFRCFWLKRMVEYADFVS